MASISKETIYQVLEASDIVSTISFYLPNLKRAGSNYKTNCPFHQERTPSFHVDPVRQRFKCFGCGEGGDAISFVMKYENLSFTESLEKLAQRANISIANEPLNPKAEQKRRTKSRLVRLLNETSSFLHTLLLTHPDAQLARTYLKERGYGKPMTQEWSIGWMPLESSLYFNWVKEQGFSPRELIAAGLANFKDESRPQAGIYLRFRNRLMFPIINDYGDTIGFSGRKLLEEAPGGKYINSPQTILFDKSRTIFALHKARRPIGQQGFALLCEGQLDAISCHEAGFTHAIAPLGTAFTETHAQLLKRYTDSVTICYDGDSAGKKAALRTFQELVKHEIQVQVLALPNGLDPDDYLKTHGTEAFQSLLEKSLPFFDYYVQTLKGSQDLSEPNHLSKALKSLIPLVQSIPDKVHQEATIHHLAHLLHITPNHFLQKVQSTSHPNRSSSPSAHLNEEQTRPLPAPLHPHLKQLCHLVLHSRETHQWLNEQLEPLLESIQGLSGEQTLLFLLSQSFQPDQPASINQLLQTCSPAEQLTLTPLLELPAPLNARLVAEELLSSLSLSHFKNQLQLKLSLLRSPSLDLKQQELLQKEILDLQAILKDISS